MIVEQPEAFKSWLTAVLKPMCDADPAALAKYVIALIKKDKSDDELRKSMIGQLEVFLEEETETFVNLVFQTLQSQEYITTPVIPNANPPNPNIVKKDKDSAKDKVIVQPSELPNLSEQINGSKKEAELKRDREIRDIRKPDNGENKDKDEKGRSARRRDLSPSRDRLRSRSRSWDRSKRSRSRDKSRDRNSPSHRGGGTDREKRDRQPRIWRNKSPPARSSRYDRRRSRTPPSPSRSPRYQHRTGRYRNRSLDRSRSRSRSRSIEKSRRDSAKDKGEHSRPGTPTQDSNHGEPDLRLTTSTQSVQSCVVLSTKRKCRDFDEKGLCMRGEMCPFDHGIDPVVLEDAALSTVLNYNPNGTAPEIPTNIPPPILTAPGHPMMGPRGVIPSEYNPQAPFLRGFRGPRPLGPTRLPSMGMFPPQPSINRELISVPVMDNKQPVYTPGYPPQGNFIPLENHDPFYHQKKNKFDFNRLGARPPRNMANCSLELKKVPAGLNSITHLNNHFSKFGKIINIQVNYEGDTEAAIVTFSSHAEASAAYRSTEAVLNNRFIKVFWHNSNNEGKQENTPPRSVKERLGLNQIVSSNTNKVLNLVQPKAKTEESGLIPPGSEGMEVKNVISEIPSLSKEEAKAQAAANIKKSQELLAAKEKLKKNQDDKRKEVMKINQDLRKRKQELLEKQLSQQKILIEKMEKLPPGPQRDLIKETIKKTQESIEGIRKDVAQSIAGKMATPQKKTKEDAQKEMLDIELDLMSKQQEGADVSEIQKKYFELKAKTAMMRRGRGRRYNPIQRHPLSKNNLIDNAVKTATKIDRTNSSTNLHVSYPKLTAHSIDHRPTRILVSGYEIEEQDNVVAHFQQFGDIAEYTTDPTLPSVTFNFKNRKDSEAALLKGKHFQDRTLSITWCSNVQHSNQINNNLTRKVVMSETEEDQLIDQSILEGDDEANGTEQELPEEVLLQDDDEDDDEDRSWRR